MRVNFEMLSVFVWIFVVTEVCGGLIKRFPALSYSGNTQSNPVQRVPSNSFDEDSFNEYYSFADQNELNVVSQIQQVDLDKVNFSHLFNMNGKTLLLVRTTRHRNKRYASYLTLCPFKICNMGRKRTRTKIYKGDK